MKLSFTSFTRSLTLLIAAAGLLYLSRITPDGGYLLEVLPALILLGIWAGRQTTLPFRRRLR